MDLPTDLNSWPQVLAANWIPSLLEPYREVRRFFKGKPNDGLYEVLEYDSVLELADPKGRTTLFKKRLRVKFLQDNIIAFQDHAWGDGDLLVDYRCSPGIEVDHYPEGDRWNALISLRETKSTGCKFENRSTDPFCCRSSMTRCRSQFPNSLWCAVP
jgi:hypothetical protein